MNHKLFLLFIMISVMVLPFGHLCCFADDEEELSEENQTRSMQAYKHGVEMVRMKAYDNAINYFNEALSYNPKLYDAYYNIASIYIKQKKYDEAYNAYVKVIALNPNDYDSILQAAKICYNRQNYALALKYLKYIPDDYDNYYLAQRLKKDAEELFNNQTQKIERSKVTASNKNKRVLIDNFESPAGMVVDSEGNIYVACYSDNSIVKVDKNKKKTTFVSGNLLNGPVGLAIDKFDNIYAANYDANNVIKITKGGITSVFMKNVSKPYFLYIKNDVLFISEQGNDAVVTYNLGG